MNNLTKTGSCKDESTNVFEEGDLVYFWDERTAMATLVLCLVWKVTEDKGKRAYHGDVSHLTLLLPNGSLTYVLSWDIKDSHSGISRIHHAY